MTSCDDDFVIVSKCETVDDFMGFGDLATFDSAMKQDTFVDILSRDRKEEVMLFLKKQQYTADVRDSFKEGRSQIWKQFYTDMTRQDITVDNHDLSKTFDYEGGRIMAIMVDRVYSLRQAEQQSKKWSFIPVMTSFLLSEPKPKPRKVISNSITPSFDPHCETVLKYVDCLALYCQQGALAGVFELLNKQYAQFNYEVYVDQGESRLSTVIYEACSDDGFPDVHIRISKDFRVFQTDLTRSTGMRQIETVNMQLDMTLFDDQNIQLRLVGL